MRRAAGRRFVDVADRDVVKIRDHATEHRARCGLRYRPAEPALIREQVVAEQADAATLREGRTPKCGGVHVARLFALGHVLELQRQRAEQRGPDGEARQIGRLAAYRVHAPSAHPVLGDDGDREALKQPHRARELTPGGALLGR